MTKVSKTSSIVWVYVCFPLWTILPLVVYVHAFILLWIKWQVNHDPIASRLLMSRNDKYCFCTRWRQSQNLHCKWWWIRVKLSCTVKEHDISMSLHSYLIHFDRVWGCHSSFYEQHKVGNFNNVGLKDFRMGKQKITVEKGYFWVDMI